MFVSLSGASRRRQAHRHRVCGTRALLVTGCATPKYPPAPNDAQVGDYNYRIGRSIR